MEKRKAVLRRPLEYHSHGFHADVKLLKLHKWSLPHSNGWRK